MRLGGNLALQGGEEAPPRLLLDLAFDGLEWSSATRHRAVAGRPEVIPPEHLPHLGEIRCTKPARAHSLERLDQPRQRHLRWVADQETYVIRLPARLAELALEALADLLPGLAQRVEDAFGDHCAPVLRDKDQMRLKTEETCLPPRKSLAFATDQVMFRLVRGYNGHQFRIYSNARQGARLLACESALRFLWNLALEQRKLGLARPSELRAEVPFLADVPRNVCAQLLVELDKAWQRCFSRLARAPRFKRKGRDSLGLTEPHPKVWRLQGNLLRFPKLGNLCAVLHRPLEGKPKSSTIRRDGDQWFVSIVCQVEQPAPVPRTDPVVALDRGITHLVADSDGTNNRKKAVLRVSRLHRKIRRQRDHVLHTLSAAYAKSHGTVVVERLQTANMIQNRPLARRIADAGWSRLVDQLRYKLAWNGGQLIEVPAAYSSQICFACGEVDAESRRGETFRCTRCAHVDHADLNAAKVLKSRANRSALPVEGAPPEGTRRSRKVVKLRVPRRSPQSPAL
jgi:putative transposase